MFTKEQTKIMKPVLGRKYVADVLAVLSSKGILSYKSQPYTGNTVRAVFGCKQGNYEIEQAILTVHENRKTEIEAFEQKRNQLLNTELA